MIRRSISFGALALLLVATIPAAGQGRSGDKKPKKTASPSTAQSTTSTPSNSALGVIYYGSWLDDASIVPPGGAWISLSTGYWRTEGARQIDAPVMSVVAGLNQRLQVGGSVPVYHYRDDTGASQSGMGTLSFYAKTMLIDPAKSPDRVGLAITPSLEMGTSGTDRFAWSFPVNIEVRRDRARFYGSTGYFSRGSIFGSIAAEIPAGERVSITGNAGRSYSRSGSHQTSLGLSAGLFVSETSSLFVGVGQTFQAIGAGPGGVSIAGGASFYLRKFR
jgi:hypothetical protein